MFESKLENVYDMKSFFYMNSIHDKYVHNIAECNLLHDILNTYKPDKNKNINYSPILQGSMNTHSVGRDIKTFQYC